MPFNSRKLLFRLLQTQHKLIIFLVKTIFLTLHSDIKKSDFFIIIIYKSTSSPVIETVCNLRKKRKKKTTQSNLIFCLASVMLRFSVSCDSGCIYFLLPRSRFRVQITHKASLSYIFFARFNTKINKIRAAFGKLNEISWVQISPL